MTSVFASPHPGSPAASPDHQHGHEQVVFCQDPHSGLRAIIAIYSTALGPGAGRDPVLPLPGRRQRPGRRAQPVPRHGLQERAGRPGSRRREGRHHRRSGHPQVRGAAPRVRPVRRVAERALHHRVRHRHLQRGHGHHRPGVAARHRPHGAERRRGRLLRAHRVRRVPGHAGRGRARLGRRQPGGPGGRRRGRGQGRPAPGQPSGRGRGVGRHLRREPGRRRAGGQPASRRAGGAGQRELIAQQLDMLARVRWAAR